jgi:type I restriction enzyme M protein
MNPPFNMSRWSTGDPSADPRWRYGPPPEHNANFAWLQHAVLSLADGGRAAVVMANGAASSENVQEQAIRAAMADDGVVECLIALPPQLFGATAVPVTIWLLRASAGKIAAPAGEIGLPAGEGPDEILFIDATTLGRMVDRNRRVLDTADIHRIAGTCEQWRARRRTGEYEDVPGFCESVTVRDIREHDYRLNPRAHVRPPVDVAAAAETVRSLRRTLGQLRARSAEVDAMADRQLDRISTWKP